MNKTAIKKDTASPEEMSLEVSVPTRNALVKQTAEIDRFIGTRQEFIQKVNAICVEGKDYHVIQGKKSLAKGGAEKIASIFQWNATFIKDHEALEMLGPIPGLVSFKCTLCKGNKFVGEGRGAATLSKNSGDPNRTIKMAQKSAFIDATLRASGLSDFFTQDLEDMNASYIGNSHPQGQTTEIRPSEKQIELIKKVMGEKNVTEEMLIDQGFDLKGLTGGKEGTASELIQFLFDYRPQATTYMAEKPSFDVEIDPSEEFKNIIVADLEACQTYKEYEKILADIKMAKINGKLSDIDYSIIVKVCNKIITKFL